MGRRLTAFSIGEVDPDWDVSAGDQVAVSLPPEKLHLFDGTTPESSRVVPAEERSATGLED